jgi:outer membrane protein
MNRSSLSAYTRLLVGLLSLVILTMGCRTDSDRYGLRELGRSREAIQTIQPLELKESEPNEAPPEANEPPPAVVELSLPECRAQALQNNLQLKATLINPTIAAAQLSEEEAKFESSFLAGLNANKWDRPSPGFLGRIEGSSGESIGGNLGVQVPLRTGGMVTFNAGDQWTKTNALQSTFNPYYSSELSASISQPLLRGAGQWVNTYSIRLAAYNRDIVGTRTRLEVINVLAALDRVYWRLYAARKDLEVRRQQYELAQAQLESVRRVVEAGQRPPVEIIRAEAGVASQLEAIIVAENSLRDRERELKRVINRAGLDMETPTVIVPATAPDPVYYDLDRPRLVREALDTRMELLELELLLLQDTDTVDLAKNQMLPLATLEYQYNVPGLGASQRQDLDVLFGADFSVHSGRLQASIPIGNEAAKSRWRQAIYQRRQRLATRANREDLIKVEVLNAADQVEANWQRILAARQTSILNGRLFEAERSQFEQGLRTSTDVFDAQIRFADAQSSEILALTEYQIALVDLAYATGTVLGAARIQWEPIVPETGGH